VASPHVRSKCLLCLLRSLIVDPLPPKHPSLPRRLGLASRPRTKRGFSFRIAQVWPSHSPVSQRWSAASAVGYLSGDGSQWEP
jgi:hypothetical protein